MASEIRVNKIENRSGLGTVTFADTGVDLAGIVTATTFSGSGASLTALPAAQVTGTLPAISGANLTNLAAANLTGTIADARFPATLPAASAANLTSIPAANITGTLPALTAANLTNIPAANIVGVCTSGLTKTGGFGGITHADQWRVTADFTFGNLAATITANWERNDTTFEKIGDGMAVDGSGHWTFPTTGKWLIQVHWTGQRTSGTTYFGQHYCYGMTDGNQNNAFELMSSASGNGNNHGRNTSFMQCIFDCQDTSGYKLLFGYYDTNGTTILRGNSAHNENSYTFIRLGDT